METTHLIPANTPLKVARVGNTEYILDPPGSTQYSAPVTPSPDAVWTEVYSEAISLTVETDQYLTDSSSPKLHFHRYIGGRPSGR